MIRSASAHIRAAVARSAAEGAHACAAAITAAVAVRGGIGDGKKTAGKVATDEHLWELESDGAIG